MKIRGQANLTVMMKQMIAGLKLQRKLAKSMNSLELALADLLI